MCQLAWSAKIYLPVCNNNRKMISFSLSFFLLHWLHFGWVIMPPMKWFKWQSSWQSEVLIQIHLLLLLGKFPEFFGRVSLQIHLLLLLLGEFLSSLAEFPTPSSLVASVAGVVNSRVLCRVSNSSTCCKCCWVNCQCCPGVWNYDFLMQQKWPASIYL